MRGKLAATLTYLAHLKQIIPLNKKSAFRFAPTALPFLPTRSNWRRTAWFRDAAIIGIVPVVVCREPKKNTVALCRVSDKWRIRRLYFSSRLPAWGRMYRLMSPTNIILNGQTVFSLRSDRDLNVLIVNGAIAPLLSARRADTLTAIYSVGLIRWIAISVIKRRTETRTDNFAPRVGLKPSDPIGYTTLFCPQVSARSMTYPLHGLSKQQVATLRNTCLKARFSRLNGLKAGNERGIHRISQSCPKRTQTPLCSWLRAIGVCWGKGRKLCW